MTRPPLSRRRAVTCILVNLLATPGLGSLWARRYLAGTLQFIFGLAGFCLTTGWMLKAIYDSLQGVSFDASPIESHVAEPNWVWQLGTILFSVSWIWSLVTSISIWREAAAKGSRHVTGIVSPPPLKLEAAQIPIALASIPCWQKNGEVISRMFQFRDFPAAMKFANAVAEIAEAAWHHPDIDIRWNKVTLALTTHDVGGLTEKDFALAKEFDETSLR